MSQTHTDHELHNWPSVARRIHEAYPQIPDADIQQVGGDSRRLVALIHQQTGGSVSEIEARIDEIASQSGGLLDRLRDSSDSVGLAAGQYLSAAKEKTSAAWQSAAEMGRGSYDSTRQAVGEYYGSTCEAIERRPMESVAIAFTAGLLCGFTLVRSMVRQPEPPTWSNRVRSWW